jgi:hypothetical protein
MSDVILGVEYQHLGAGRQSDEVNLRATVDLTQARIVFKWTTGGPAAAQ